MRLPDFEPMLATRWPAPFEDEDWWFEVKWDGYRAVVGSVDGKIRARSRRGLDLIGPFPELARLDIPDGVVIDGEITVFDDEGRPSFSLLQRRTGFGGTGTGDPVGVNLVAFDVLFRGEDLTSKPYEERRAVLDDLGLEAPIHRARPHTDSWGETLRGGHRAWCRGCCRQTSRLHISPGTSVGRLAQDFGPSSDSCRRRRIPAW